MTLPVCLPENAGIAYSGASPRSPLVLSAAQARRMLAAPNPHGKPNSDVIRPLAEVADLLQHPRQRWVIDFAPDLDEREAALYRLPFARALGLVRAADNRAAGAPQRTMRIAIAKCSRCIVTPAAGPRRVLAWLPAETLPGRGLVVFARDDDGFFGVLHSRFHAAWALRVGAQLREREADFRYTPTTCFETFPFPWAPTTPLGKLTRTQDGQRTAIARAAQALDAARNEWLGDRSDPRRTLPALYHEQPAWLQHARAELDAAVAAAYGSPADLPDEDVVARLLALNRARAPSAPAAPPGNMSTNS